MIDKYVLFRCVEMSQVVSCKNLYHNVVVSGKKYTINALLWFENGCIVLFGYGNEEHAENFPGRGEAH